MNEIKNTQKVQIERLRTTHLHVSSSHAFASLYLWQQAMGLSISCTEDYFVVKCKMNGENSYFFPCGNYEKIYEYIASQIAEESFSFCYMRNSDVRWLEEHFPGKWEFRRVETADEYICDISEFLELRGSNFSEIRRKIRKIDREYNITVKRIEEDTIQDAIDVVSEWHSGKHSINKQNLSDRNIAEKALTEMAFLDISGIIVYLENVPSAVFAGFPLSADTIDVLIGKTIADSPKGLVYYGLREYLKICADTYQYCNHEEDLGIPGIRQMKQSLRPIYKIEMWEAVLK